MSTKTKLDKYLDSIKSRVRNKELVYDSIEYRQKIIEEYLKWK